MNNHMNQKGFVNIILVVVIVAVAAIGGYFVLSKKSAIPTTPPVPPTQLQDTKPITPSPVSKPDSALKPTPTIPTRQSSPSSSDLLTDKPLIKVTKFSSVGTTEEPTSVVDPPEYEFKLSPFERLWAYVPKAKELLIDGIKVKVEALEAYELEQPEDRHTMVKKIVCAADGVRCFETYDWMVVSVNGTNIELIREDIVKVVFENNLTIYISAIDVEGVGSSAGSDLIIKKK